ncbi:beta-ketoacyl synthase N-terminal-like domain-containing protein [Streptomyces sp. SCSIO ZS0520]|uniref:beta-ketoacyl synthase N-terminal-like domain-containing protein n=1 Tax=Streptomyces sp. SCSIO ZS0520 TaxID=2892996 RepID=UPI0021DA2C40|nr:beta-ketoacyl synthase N-terminal-like domain-containing protein [Streptomyces sp. SCSIO ZS0520]
MSWDIIGMGAVANLGDSPGAVFEALCASRESRAPLRAFDRTRYRGGYAYEIDDRPADGADEPLRATRWLTTAIRQALADAGLDEGLGRIPVLVGTTLREQRSAELWWREGTALDPAALHFGPALGAAFGAEDAHTFANACSASLGALALGTDLLALGMADTVVVAGSDSMTESAFGTLDRVQNEIPRALRPFDTTHKGMLMGEGAVAVVLRRSADTADTADDTDGTGPARQRAPRVHARLRSVGVNCDARHATAPDAEGIDWVVREAHRRAGLGPADVDLVMCHGSGTPRNDETEAAVLGRIFPGSGGPLMTAIKSLTGHTLGGSGLLSLVMGVLAARHQTVPPVHGLTEPIPEAAGLRLVRGAAVAAAPRIVQVNAFGLGGINAVAMVEAA